MPGPVRRIFFQDNFLYFSMFEIARRTHNRTYNNNILYWIGANVISQRTYYRFAVSRRYTSSFVFIIYYYTYTVFFMRFMSHTYIGVRVTNYSGDAPEDAAGKQIFDRTSRTRLGLYYYYYIIVLIIW